MTTSHRERHMQKTMVYIWVALGVLVVFLMLFGLNFAIRSSLLFSNINDEEANAINQDDDNFFGSLFFNDPESATNSASLMLSGSVTNYDTVTLYINNVKAAEVKPDDDGYFEEEVGDLTPGDNEIYARASVKGKKHVEKSEVHMVSYLNQKPTLEVSEPAPNSRTNNQEVMVKGSTTGKTVRINNSPVVTNAEGGFQKSVRLKEGENIITVTTADEAGNEEKIQMKVTYEKDE